MYVLGMLTLRGLETKNLAISTEMDLRDVNLWVIDMITETGISIEIKQ